MFNIFVIQDTVAGTSYGKDGEIDSDSSSDSDDIRPLSPPAGQILYGSRLMTDPAVREKRKAKEVDPDFSILDEGPEEEDIPLITQRRKRSRTLTIQDGMYYLKVE